MFDFCFPTDLRPGVYTIQFAPPPLRGIWVLVGWGKIWWFNKKKREIRGGKKGGKRKFLLYLGTKYDFWKGGGGQNINYFDTIHPRLGLHRTMIRSASHWKKISWTWVAKGQNNPWNPDPLPSMEFKTNRLFLHFGFNYARGSNYDNSMIIFYSCYTCWKYSFFWSVK